MEYMYTLRLRRLAQSLLLIISSPFDVLFCFCFCFSVCIFRGFVM
jgi:hypothetical protein